MAYVGNNSSDYLGVEDYPDWEPYEQAAASISFFLFVVIAVLNGIVIYVLLFRQKKKSRLYFFILHLAIADLSVGLINVLGDGIQSAMYSAWYGGDVLCKIWRYSKIVVLIASNNILIGMSINRFMAIKCPLSFVTHGNLLDKVLVICAWIIGIVLAIYAVRYTDGVNGLPEEDGGCNINLPEKWWKPYAIIMAVCMYVVPTLFITACYTGITVVIWKQWKKGLKLSEVKMDYSYDRLNQPKNKNRGLLPRAKLKSVKMTLVVCLAFFLCWTPYFIFILLDVYEVEIDRRLMMVLMTVYPLNSACNPIVFICFNWKLFSTRPEKRISSPYYNGQTTQITST